MEKGNLPIRMINIAKCYRRQEDVSHTTMFHQFEGLFIDKNVSIGNLKGVMDFFLRNITAQIASRELGRSIFNLLNHHLRWM